MYLLTHRNFKTIEALASETNLNIKTIKKYLRKVEKNQLDMYFPAKRKCGHEGCITLLSAYNNAKYCDVHKKNHLNKEK